MYIYRILVTIICSLMLYPEYSVTEESIKDVVTTSKRTLPTEEKKSRAICVGRKFTLASCLTEMKSNEVSKPLIIPGNVFTHGSVVRCRVSNRFGKRLWSPGSVTHAISSRPGRV